MSDTKTSVSVEQMNTEINKEGNVDTRVTFVAPAGVFDTLAERLEYLGYPKQATYGIDRAAWICGASKSNNVRRMITNPTKGGYRITAVKAQIAGTKTVRWEIAYAEVERYYLYRQANLLSQVKAFSDPALYSTIFNAAKVVAKSAEEIVAGLKAQLSPEMFAGLMAELKK